MARAAATSSIVSRHDDAQWLDLVDRGVGGIAAAAGAIEQHLAADFAGQPAREAGIAREDLPAWSDPGSLVGRLPGGVARGRAHGGRCRLLRAWLRAQCCRVGDARRQR